MSGKSFINRRSFMTRVSGLALAGGSLATVTGCATGIAYTGVSDTDPTDPVGYGRTGLTDADPVDPVGRGRGRSNGITDADAGQGADPVGRGRGNRFRPYVGATAGSGFMISEDGHIATSFHVVRARPEISVDYNGATYAAQMVASDEANDIAILKIEASGFALPIGSARQLRVGEDVIAMGYPLSQIQGSELRASFGRINALSGIGSDARFIQIDTPVQPGNSGGPLLGPDGRVVAVVAARLDDLATLRATGALPQNVSFGVRIDYLLPLVPVSVTLNSTPLSGSTADRVEAARRGVVLVRTAAVAEAGPQPKPPEGEPETSPPTGDNPAPTPPTVNAPAEAPSPTPQ
jgi:S1-C subfamily serine protease